MERRLDCRRRAVHCGGLGQQPRQRVEGGQCDRRDCGDPHRRAHRGIEHPGGQKPCVLVTVAAITAEHARVTFTDADLNGSTVPRMPAVVNDPRLGFVCSVSCSCSRTGKNTRAARADSTGGHPRSGSAVGGPRFRCRGEHHPSLHRGRGWRRLVGAASVCSIPMSGRHCLVDDSDARDVPPANVLEACDYPITAGACGTVAQKSGSWP